jgi:YHS domain-containing protein
MKNYKLIVLTMAFFTQIAIYAQNTTARTHVYNLKNGVALAGYDPVAYFTSNKAVEGNKNYAYTYQAITYYFTSEGNKNIFIKNPAAYEPQYGGWCAYAMGATGEKVEVDPETFKILNGKLYLFYHTWLNNTLTKWNNNESQLKTNADINWKKIFR